MPEPHRQDPLWSDSRSAYYAVGLVIVLLVMMAGRPSFSEPPPAPRPDIGPPPSPAALPPEQPVLSEEEVHALYTASGELTANALEPLLQRHRERLGGPCSRERLRRARELALRGDHASAVTVLAPATRDAAEPGSSCDRHRFRLALSQHALEHRQAALASLERLSDAHPIPDHVELLRGELLAELGRHEEAIASFDAVREDSDSPRYHEAFVRRAESLYQSGRWGQAEEALSRIIEELPEYPRIEQIRLLRGRTWQALERPERAARDFEWIVFNWAHKEAAREAAAELETLAEAGVEIPSRSFDERYERARSLRKNRHWELAEEAYEALLEEVATERGTSEWENRLWLQLALNAYESSDYDTAIPILERLYGLFEGESRVRGLSRRFVLGRIIRAHAYAGEFEAAKARVVERDTRVSDEARALRMARFLEENGRFAEALELRDEELSERDKRSWDFAFLLFNAGSYERAAERFEALVQRESGRDEDQMRYWQARSLAAAGENDEARALYTIILDEEPMTYYGVQAANRLAELDALEARAAGRAAASRDVVLASVGEVRESGAEGAGEGGAGGTVIWGGVTTMQQLRGERREIADTGERASGLELTPRRAMSVLTPGDRAVPTGDARIHWSGNPFYVGAFDRHGETTGRASEKSRGAFKPDYIHDDQLEGSLHRAAERYGELFPRLVRASFLYDVGLETEARWEIRDVALELRGLFRRAGSRGRTPKSTKPWRLPYYRHRHLRDKRKEKSGFWGADMGSPRFPVPDGLEARKALAARQTAIIEARDELEEPLWDAFKEAGDYYLVRRRSGAYRLRSHDPLEGRYLDRWSEALPRAFPRLVQGHCESQRLNPYLVWSIMRVESEFNPDTISWADARGLLQVIPKTGIKVATSMGVDEYGPHDLLDERRSIQFGTWYLGQLVAKFHGQELLAASGYNGGPHNVARWVTMRGHAMDLDAFIETIPYNETRKYAKKTLRYIAIYQRVYEGRDLLYVGNRIDDRFLPHPNY